MNNPVIQMQNVRKSFEGKVVLDGLNLSLPQGAVVGLLGKNGVGKSTLIKCALGLIKPQGGDVKVFGEDSWDLSAEAKARIGYVPQEVKLNGYMTIEHLIAYTRAFYTGWNDRFVTELLEKWELAPSEKISKISEGMLQKLGIILALGHEPDLLIFDEPVAGLDPQARRDFLRMVLNNVSLEQRTALLSTHLTTDIERVASHVAILKGGGIIYFGTLDDLKDSVKRLRLFSDDPLPSQLDFPGMLRQEVSGQEALLVLRDITPTTVTEIKKRWNASVEVESLPLEDIFMELHHD